MIDEAQRLLALRLMRKLSDTPAQKLTLYEGSFAGTWCCDQHRVRGSYSC
jgi:hypothetical protein